MNQKISIILPTYNGEKYISRAIESVLAQSFLHWELIIIDDGSSDNTEKIVKKFSDKDSRVIYLKNEANLGIQKTLNRGLREAKGDYIARIDDDDEWIDKDKLQKQIEFFNNNSEYILVGTGVVIVDENNNELFRYLSPLDDKEIRGKILGRNCFVHSGVIFKKDIALKLGGYSEDKSTKHIEDYDLWLKFGMEGKLANISSYSVSFTLRSESISSSNRLTQAIMVLKLIRKYKDKYPNFKFNYFISFLRLFFFFIQKISPLSNKVLYKIQSFYKKI